MLTEVNCLDGRYVVDEDLVRKIIRSHFRAAKMLDHSGAAPIEPGSKIKSLQVDWDKVRSEGDALTRQEVLSQWSVSMERMQPRILRLAEMHDQTQGMRERFRQKMVHVQRDAAAALRSEVEHWETMQKGAELLRDGAASFLMIGATVMSGGTALALGAGGTALNGVSKYQSVYYDAKLMQTESAQSRRGRAMSAAMISVTGDLIFTVVPLMRGFEGLRNAKGATNATLLVMEAAWESSGSLVEGKSIGEALQAGGVKIVMGGVVSPALEQAIARPVTKMAFPVTTRHFHGRAIGWREDHAAAALVGKGVQKLAGSGLKSGTGAAIGWAEGALADDAVCSGDERSLDLADHAVLGMPLLVEQAVQRVG